MKIRITKSAMDTYWYADKIGEVFEVLGEVDEWGYVVAVYGGQGTFMVDYDDAEVVE